MKNLSDYQTGLIEQLVSTLHDTEEKEHVQNIIIDAIMFERLSLAMQRLLKVFDPTTKDSWEPANEYFGVYNSFNALGIKHPSDFNKEKLYLALTGPLIKIFNEMVERDMEDQSKKTAEDLAKYILLEWECFVKKVRFGKITLEF